MTRLALALLLAALLPAAAALAQSATLVADRVDLRPGQVLVAQGNVEVLYGESRMRAARVTYDGAADRLQIEGPITLVDGDSVVVVADQAALDTDLRNGILEGARLVLDRQLQLAANRITRVDGRYTLLTKSVASSCEICPGSPTPTWEIRARRIIHDQDERQLYFDHATFRLLGVPIFYAPRLRLPDPTLKRASGFLLPTVNSTSQLSTGLKLPYFVKLGDHADVTLTPYASAKTRTLEAAYRHETARGPLSFRGAVSRDKLQPGTTRHYLFGEGSLRTGADFILDFGLQSVSDPAYLLDYAYSDQDRLRSFVGIRRYRRDEAIMARVNRFRTLRATEIPIRDELPRTYAQAEFERTRPLGGGMLTFGVDAATVQRESTADVVGRDTQRLGGSADWRVQGISRAGMVGELRLGAAAHVYNTAQDSSFQDQTARMTTRAEATLRWPFARVTPGGAHQLVEPVAQVAWARTNGNTVPNEDSVLVEFDEGNLFALSRYPGLDGVETGTRANLGVRFTHLSPRGWELGAAVGRVARFADTGQFTTGTGLNGSSSDWLVAAQLKMGGHLAITARTLFEDDLSVTRAESRVSYAGGRASAAATYVWLREDVLQNRPDPTHELTAEGAYRLTRNWTGRLSGRFNLEADRAAAAGLGLEYRSECITVDLSLSRRFTSSTSVDPTTDFGLRVSLAGFGTGQDGDAAPRACRG